MNIERVIVGVDFSLTSPAACIILRDEDGRDHFRWITVYYDENPGKLLKNESGAFYTVSRSKHIRSLVLEKDRSFKPTYSEAERSKMVHGLNLGAILTEEIRLSMQKASAESILDGDNTMTSGFEFENTEVYLSMEGISFGSKGNSLIDICISTGIVRKNLINRVVSADRFYVLSPTTVKAFAIHGSSGKSHLMHALMAHEDADIQGSELVVLMHENRDMWVTAGGTVKKPIEDLSDSTWVALALRSILDGDEVESVRKPKRPKKKKTKSPNESKKK